MVGRSAAGFVTLASLVAVALMGASCWAKHSFLQQSFDELVLECAELLSIAPSKMTSLRTGVLRNDNDTKCLVRCVGVSGRFWNDYTGMRKDLLGLYFNAASGDSENVHRTQTCLDKLPSRAPRQDFCDLAFESFLCFYHNYGNLHRHRVFVPLDNMQLLHVTARCMEVHRITVEDLMSLTEDELDENRNVHCLVRCIGVQTGIYSDRFGVNLDRVYTQYGEGHDERKYKEDAQACLTRHAGASCSPCLRAYNMLYKCFETVRNVITEFELPDSNED